MDEQHKTIYCVSDSVGLTAQALARAATAQFGSLHFSYEVLAEAKDFATI